MSVRVNLLPRETYARQAAARQRMFVGLGGLVLVALLAGAYFFQMNTLSNARDDRDAAQAELDQLAAREAQLAEFRDLEQRLEERQEVIATALVGELSFAGILQDVAAVMPTDAALTEFNVTAVADTGPDGGAVREIVARISAGGESLRGHAPGVERLLLEFDKIAAFFDIYVTNSELDEEDEDEDVAIFTFEVDVGQEARTNRYVEGVPEGLR
jgi:hypothetical protein